MARSALRSTGSTDRWRKIRAKIINRDQCCQICGTESKLTVDHIIPRRLGGTDEPSNLQTLCVSCNSRKGGRFFVSTPTPPTPLLVSNPRNTSISHDPTSHD